MPNVIYEAGNLLDVVVTHPTGTGGPAGVSLPKAQYPVRVGSMVGFAEISVLMTGPKAGMTTVRFGSHVRSAYVRAVNGSGNSAIAAGDKLYYVDGDLTLNQPYSETNTALSKKDSGVFFGYALESITSGQGALIRVYKTAI
jgi:hypothetical protein